MAFPNAPPFSSGNSDVLRVFPEYPHEYSPVKFMPGTSYEQAGKELGGNMTDANQSSDTPNLVQPFVHPYNELVRKRAHELQYHTPEQEAHKRRLMSLPIGDKHEIREFLGWKLDPLSRYAKNCKAQRCRDIWRGLKTFQNHCMNNYNKHLKEFENKDGTHTCCDQTFPKEDIASHIWNKHMEGVGTFSLPKGLASAQVEDAVSVSTSASGTFSIFETPRSAPTRTRGYTLASHRGPMFNSPLLDLTTPPVLDLNTPPPVPTKPDHDAMLMPPPFFHNENQQIHGWNPRGLVFPGPSTNPAAHRVYDDPTSYVGYHTRPYYVDQRHLYRWRDDVNYM